MLNDPVVLSVLFGGVSLVLPAFARCLGTVLFAPFWGGRETPRIARLIVAIGLTVVIFPVAVGNMASISYDVALSWNVLPKLLVKIGQEFIFGASIGLSLAVFFNGIYLAGETISRMSGISILGVFDPTSGSEVSALSRLYFWTSLALFISLGGVEIFLDGFLNTFHTIPVGVVVSPEDFVWKFVKLLSMSFQLGIRLAVPVIAVVLIVYLTFGFIGRTISQLDLTFIAFNCNSLLALFVIFLTFSSFCYLYREELIHFLEALFGGNA